MASSGPEINQNFELTYFLYYFSYSTDQILKMSEMAVAILSAYWTSDSGSG